MYLNIYLNYSILHGIPCSYDTILGEIIIRKYALCQSALHNVDLRICLHSTDPFRDTFKIKKIGSEI